MGSFPSTSKWCQPWHSSLALMLWPPWTNWLAVTSFKTHEEELQDYLDYFNRTWIGPFKPRGGRRPPKFPIQLWNCRESVLQDQAKTNNNAEGFNRGFSSLLSYDRPTLPKFVCGLLKQHAITATNIEQFNSRPPPLPLVQANLLRLIC